MNADQPSPMAAQASATPGRRMNCLCAAVVGCLLAGTGWAAQTSATPNARTQLPAAADAPPNIASAGEDLGKPPEPLWIEQARQIARQMRQAGELLESRRTTRETQSQQQNSLDQLNRLIEDLEGGQSPSGKLAGGSTQTDGSTDGATPPAPPTSPPTPPTPPNSAPAGGERIWGHLPQRLRERMRSAGVEEFLPQYESLLEAYYRRLAEP
ncbi:MAG: hypothetical protein KDB14_03205 [Planctomycetales bacterium]|nr:hypothetical protein [Planctomycetales bacterium]